MAKKKYDFDINNRGHSRHHYLFIMPMTLYRKVKSMADERGVSLRSMLIELIRDGIKSDELEERR